MKKTSQRARRVGDEIQRDLAELLRSEVKDPRVGPVTITAVDVSPDLSHAKVFVTHMVSRRRKLLDYLKSRNSDSYRTLIEKLGLRK